MKPRCPCSEEGPTGFTLPGRVSAATVEVACAVLGLNRSCSAARCC